MGCEMFNGLWVERYRPQNIEDLVLSPDIRAYFENLIKKGEIPHLLFCGPAGTGKTTLAKILVKELDAVYRYINASDERGIDSIREKIIPFAQTKSIDGHLKVIILDEADGQTSESQRALRNVMEEYSDNLRFIMTANYKNKIITPLKSRVISFELMPPLKEVITRACFVLTNENVTVPDIQKPILKELIESNYPDIRKVIGLLQKYSKDGILNITQDSNIGLFARDVLKKIREEKNITAIREFIIQNETDFGSDYLTLLKGLFDEIYILDIEESKKASALVLIGDAMYKHQFVMDTEINTFCCIIQLRKIIN
jgi:DNA polymerase III delta prime subunit